eukprot:Skav229738  [mRNA]  locus=scaffold1287:202519:210463:+ [translate_table: standard]
MDRNNWARLLILVVGKSKGSQVELSFGAQVRDVVAEIVGMDDLVDDSWTAGLVPHGALPDTALYGPYKSKKRPKIASEVTTVKERGGKSTVTTIQATNEMGRWMQMDVDGEFGEHRIRDLNDEINKDLREKGYWEDQTLAQRMSGQQDLPGVRELFETEIVPDAPRKTRSHELCGWKQLFQYIQPDYYGWRDEEDGMLVLAEQMFEEQAVKKAMENWTEPAPKETTKKRKTKDQKEEEKKEVVAWWKTRSSFLFAWY